MKVSGIHGELRYKVRRPEVRGERKGGCWLLNEEREDVSATLEQCSVNNEIAAQRQNDIWTYSLNG